MSAPELRTPARHAVQPGGIARRYPLVVVMLVALASLPTLAIILAGSASLESTAQPRTPFVAPAGQDPLIVPGDRPQVGAEQRVHLPAQAPPGRPPARGNPTRPAEPARPLRTESGQGGTRPNGTPTPPAPSVPPKPAPDPDASGTPECSPSPSAPPPSPAPSTSRAPVQEGRGGLLGGVVGGLLGLG